MPTDYKTKETIGAEKRAQLNYNQQSKAQKDMEVNGMPFMVLDSTAAQAGTSKVGKGNVCRIFGATTDLVRFSDEPIGSAPTATDQDAAQLGATVQRFVASGEF